MRSAQDDDGMTQKCIGISQKNTGPSPFNIERKNGFEEGGGQQVQQRQQQRNHLEHGEPDLDNDYNQTVVFVAAVVI